MNKVFWSDLDVAMHETALDLLGAESELRGPWLDGYLFSLSGPIYAGTNEVQHNVIAERILGLPREPQGGLMDFRLTPEQTGFAQSLGELMSKADSVAAARAWAEGDHDPGLALWKRLAEQGVTALVAPEDDGGLGGTLVDLVVAFEVLGHHLAVGPWIESAALAPQVDGDMVTVGGR